MFFMFHKWKEIFFQFLNFVVLTIPQLNSCPLIFLWKIFGQGSVLLKSPLNGYTYEWPPHPPSSHNSHSVFSTMNTSLQDWYQRLGHPSDIILHQIVNHYSIPISINKKFYYDPSMRNKSHRLLLGNFSLSSSQPLQLVYLDVRGPASLKSHAGYSFMSILWITSLSMYGFIQ